jgi:hypothetical protein
VDRPLLDREPGAPGPQDLRAPVGATTWWCAGYQDLKWVLKSGIQMPLGPRDPGRLREPGPYLGFDAQGGFRDLGPGSLLISWPLCKVRVLCDIPPLSKDGPSYPRSLRGPITEVMIHNTSHTRIKHMKCYES